MKKLIALLLCTALCAGANAAQPKGMNSFEYETAVVVCTALAERADYASDSLTGVDVWVAINQLIEMREDYYKDCYSIFGTVENMMTGNYPPFTEPEEKVSE